MTAPIKWRVSGSYYEVCNCDAICPCRRQGGRPAGRFTYDTCDFALSWFVREGAADEVELSGLRVVLAGRWDNARPPWHVILYVDERANGAQQGALTDIFLGRDSSHELRPRDRRSVRRETRQHRPGPQPERPAHKGGFVHIRLDGQTRLQQREHYLRDPRP
jgi:hypothetical protein